MDGAGAEPDSYHTPRIAGIITNSGDKTIPVFIVGIKAYHQPARGTPLKPEPGKLIGISTYKGSLDNPEAREPATTLPQIDFKGSTAEELAQYLFAISAADYKGNDIRVCAVGVIRSASGTWTPAIKK